MPETTAIATIYAVGLYLVDRAFGGPEEGGWWYDCGELVSDATIYRDLIRDMGEVDGMPHYFLDEDAAYEHCARLNEVCLGSLNEGRREISSVLSDGQYQFQVHEGTLPLYYPQSKPHYE